MPLLIIFLQAYQASHGMSDEFWKNFAAILLSVSLVVTAIGGVIMGFRNSRKIAETKEEIKEVKKIINGGKETGEDTKVVGRFEGIVEPKEENKDL